MALNIKLFLKNNIYNLILGVTRIHHDKWIKQIIKHCPTKDCFNLNLQYTNSMVQMKAVIAVSESCQQYIDVSTF